ncbi:MAG: T9SS type A sorting domain-containing protein [Bacteroidales bacterium]
MNIKAGPNPSSGQITVSMAPGQDVTIETTMYSYLGVKVIEFDQVELTRKAQVTLNYTLYGIPDGLYFMTFKWISDGKQRSYIEKLVIVK